jgi:hypothetical protein
MHHNNNNGQWVATTKLQPKQQSQEFRHILAQLKNFGFHSKRTLDMNMALLDTVFCVNKGLAPPHKSP